MATAAEKLRIVGAEILEEDEIIGEAWEGRLPLQGSGRPRPPIKQTVRSGGHV